MNYQLTWKRKMSITLIKSFTAAFIMLFNSALTLYAQRDTLVPVMLDPVEISRVKPNGEQPFAGTTVGREEINQRVGNGSINNLMELVPSMITTSDAGTGIGNTNMRIRGIDHTRINVTINGVELNDAESQGTWFVNLPNFGAYTQNFTLQRGVGTSTNGAAAFGASMNFLTQSQKQKPFFEFHTAAGSFATFRNTISAGTGLLKERFSAAISYSNLQSQGFIDRASADLNSIFFTADYHLINKKRDKNYGTLRFNVLYGKEITGLSWDGVPSYMLVENRTYNPCGEYEDAFGDTRYYDNETDNYQQTHYQLFYTKSFQKTTQNFSFNRTIHAGLHLTRGLGYYEQYKDDVEFSDYGLSNFMIQNEEIEETDLVSRKYLDNYFYGFVFNFTDHIVSTQKERPLLTYHVGGALNHYDGLHYGNIIWMQYAGESPANYEWYRNHANKIQANIYGKVEYMVTQKLMLYGDVQYRFVRYRMKGVDDNITKLDSLYQWKNFFNPKIGMNYYLDQAKKNSLYLSFAMSHREPTRSDLLDAPNDRKPTPETLYDFELGYLLNTSEYAFNANAYFMYYDDQLVLTGEINNVGDAIMVNVDKSYRAGIELVSMYRPVRFFRWSINGTFSLNKILNYTHYVDDWDTGEQRVMELGATDISFSPAIVASNEFVFTPLRNFDISLITKFVSRQFLDNTGDKQHSIKPYTFTNLQLSYKLHTRPIPEIGFFFQLNNIFDMKYETNGWLYRYYESDTEGFMDGYFPQAGINVMGGISIKF